MATFWHPSEGEKITFIKGEKTTIIPYLAGGLEPYFEFSINKAQREGSFTMRRYSNQATIAKINCIVRMMEKIF